MIDGCNKDNFKLQKELEALRAQLVKLESELNNYRQVEAKLKSSVEIFRAIFEGAAEGIIVADIQTKKFLFTNQAICQMFGYRSDELSRLTVFDIHPKDSLEHVISEFEAQIRGENKIASDLPCRRKNGTIFYAEVQVSCLNIDGRDCVAGFFSDITEHKKAEEKLRESEKRFIDLLYASKDAILLIDDNAFVDCNDATAHMLGYLSTDDCLMVHPSELSPPTQPDGRDSLEKANEMIKIALENGYHRFEWLHQKASGEKLPVEVSLTPITYQGKTILHCLWRDLTSQKRIEEEKTKLEVQLAHAQKLESIGQLASGIAHEINTPTQYIADNTNFLKKGFSDLKEIITFYEELRGAVVGYGDHKDIVTKIQALEQEINLAFLKEEIPQSIEEMDIGLQQITRIVKGMKEFSHPATEEKKRVDINKALETVLSVSRNEWKYVAKVVKNFESETFFVACYPGDLNQVFLNIVVNAAQAIAGVRKEGEDIKGIITITTAFDKDWAKIEIADNGPGMPNEIQKKIFDPFFTTKEVGKGTGQGLSIAYSIVVNKHGGNIYCDSKVGEGTTFKICLPA